MDSEDNTSTAEQSPLSLFHARFPENKPVIPFPDSRLRSILWRILLLPDSGPQLENLLAAVRTSRATYASLHKQYVIPLLEAPPPEASSTQPLDVEAQLKEALEDQDHPLNPVSAHWATLRASEGLRQEIAQDVERCMPDDPFFRAADVQRRLGDLIFVWCRQHVGVDGYRQGMHELAGMVMSVVHVDAGMGGGDARLDEILSLECVEQDTYALFERVMGFTRDWYFVKDDEGESSILATSRRVFYEYLPKADPELAGHLKRLDVLPQIFLMRWVRLLFGREFKSANVQQMWDLLLSYGRKAELERAVEGTCLIMILRIRWELLDSDTNGALTLLLRYPPLEELSMLRPVDFVRDGTELVSSLGQETGASIIEKYTGRSPAPYVAHERPTTPSHPGAPFLYPATSLLGRARSPFSTSSPATLESLISDAAKGVLRSGERWGVNQAVRDVVRNLQQHAATSSISSTPTRYGPGRRRPSGGAKSETHGVIAANVLRRMNALEQRNKRLAGMLDEGVQELWKLYEQMSESNEKSEKSEDSERLDRMCTAVAKVQFVQAFLKDMTLPLPDEEEQKQQPKADETQKAPETPKSTQPNKVKRSQSRSQVRPSTPQIRNRDSVTSTPTGKAFERMPSPQRPSIPENIGVNIPKASMQDSSSEPLGTSLPVSLSLMANHQVTGLSTSPSKSPDRSPSPVSPNKESTTTPSKPRRPLAESSFSWMLADSVASANDGSPAFTRATSFTPNERRTHVAAIRSGRAKGKGFLFGEDATSSDGAVSGSEENLGRGRRVSRKSDAIGDHHKGDTEEIGLHEVGKEQWL